MYYPYLGLRLDFPASVVLPAPLRERLDQNWQPHDDEAKTIFTQVMAGGDDAEAEKTDPKTNDETKDGSDLDYSEPPQQNQVQN